MKKLMLVMLSMLALALVPAMADQDTYSKPGSLSAQVGLGINWGYIGGFDVEGGADVGLLQLALAPQLPLDFGAAARVGFNTWGGLTTGVFGTASYSWKSLGLGIAWVDQLESYIGLGVRVVPGFDLDAFGGNAYHFDKNLSVFVEGGYYANVLGVAFSL